jgi:uncharacterized iron-regulated membrane protein
MNSLILKGVLRQWVAKLHRWSGLALLLFLFVAGLTGAILAFRWEIDRAINPKLFTVASQSQALSQGELIARIEQTHPQALVSTIILPQSKTDVAIVYLKSKMEAHAAHVHVVGMKGSIDFNQLLVNPYTAEVLAERSSAKLVMSWANFIPDMVRLHYTLFLDEFGAWLMGVSALVWFVTTFVGVWLAWPSTWRALGSWRSVLSVRWGKGGYKLNYDLHRSPGLITLPILLVVAFTSVYLNLPVMVKPVVKALSPATGSFVVPKVATMDPAALKVSAEEAMGAAQSQYPAGRIQSVGRDFGKGVYSVRVQLPGDVSPTGNTTVYVSMKDARPVAVRSLEGGSAGDVFQAWMFPLHTGQAFGLLGQWLIFLGAVVLVLACYTGLYVWLRKRRGKQSQRARHGAVARPA